MLSMHNNLILKVADPMVSDFLKLWFKRFLDLTI